MRDDLKFGISVNKLAFSHRWSFGVSLSNEYDETYLSINFFKWCVFIGFFHEIVW